MSNIPFRLLVKPVYNGYKTLDGNAYRFRFRWGTVPQKWHMNIKGLNTDLDRKGIPLLCGKDLFKPLGRYELGELWMIDNSGADEDPNYEDMGGRFTLEYVPLEDA